MKKDYIETLIESAFNAIIAQEYSPCEGCEKPTKNDYCDECVEELRELNKQQQEQWWNQEDQDPRWIDDVCRE